MKMLANKKKYIYFLLFLLFLLFVLLLVVLYNVCLKKRVESKTTIENTLVANIDKKKLNIYLNVSNKVVIPLKNLKSLINNYDRIISKIKNIDYNNSYVIIERNANGNIKINFCLSGYEYETKNNTCNFKDISLNYNSNKELIILSKIQNLYLRVGDRYDSFKNIITNYDDVNKILWTSSNTNVASIDNAGQIIAIKEGRVTISAVINNKAAIFDIYILPVEKNTNDIEKLRNNLKDDIIGFSLTDANNKLVKKKLDLLDENSVKIYKDFYLEGASKLWGYRSKYKSKPDTVVSNVMINIEILAEEYSTPGTSYYKNVKYKSAIVSALNNLIKNYYNGSQYNSLFNNGSSGNWYDWEVTAATNLSKILLLMKDDFTDDQIKNYVGALKGILDNPKIKYGMANLVSRVYIQIAYSSIVEDEEYLYNSVNKLYGSNENKSVFEYTVKKGDGFYLDGSYVFHKNLSYNGGYGTWMLNRLSNIIAPLSDTKYNISYDQYKNQINWISDSFDPIIYEGKVFAIVRGRFMSSSSSEPQRNSVEILSGLLEITKYKNLPADKLNYVKSFIKNIYLSNSSYKYEEYLNINQISILYEILNDNSIIPKSNYSGSKVFYNMDKVIKQNIKYSAGLSMSSNRIRKYESLSGVNETGWYSGDGMLNVYTNSSQFDANYFKNVNPYRLPGVTNTDTKRDKINTPQNDDATSPSTFAGGTTFDSNLTVAAMRLESKWKKSFTFNSSLIARKSWFMFDNEIVALGSYINSNDNSNVITTYENRSLSSGDYLLVNDKNYTIKDTVRTAQSVSSVFLSNYGGIYFPGNTKLKINKYNENNFSFIELYKDHGINPVNDSYQYILLPNSTRSDVVSYSSNPDVEIICNSSAIQAVKENKLNYYGIVSYGKSNISIDGVNISTSKLGIIAIKNKGNEFNISYADPTHSLGSIDVTISNININKIYSSDNISIMKDGNKTIIHYDLSKKNGQTYFVKFNK